MEELKSVAVLVGSGNPFSLFIVIEARGLRRPGGIADVRAAIAGIECLQDAKAS